MHLTAAALLRPGLLAGRRVLTSGTGLPLADALTGLGAELIALRLLDSDEASDAWVAEQAAAGAVDGLVLDTGPTFAAGGLSAVLDGLWPPVRAAAAATLIPAAAGRIVLLAPRPEAGRFAAAARDAVVNLARTASIEWARHDILTTALLPGAASTDAELAALAAFLLSPAGNYYTGCAFTLR